MKKRSDLLSPRFFDARKLVCNVRCLLDLRKLSEKLLEFRTHPIGVGHLGPVSRKTRSGDLPSQFTRFAFLKMTSIVVCDNALEPHMPRPKLCALRSVREHYPRMLTTFLTDQNS